MLPNKNGFITIKSGYYQAQVKINEIEQISAEQSHNMMKIDRDYYYRCDCCHDNYFNTFQTKRCTICLKFFCIDCVKHKRCNDGSKTFCCMDCSPN